MLAFLSAWFGTRTHLLREQTRDRGASSIEWVIITAALIAIAVALVLVIRAVVEARSEEIY